MMRNVSSSSSSRPPRGMRVFPFTGTRVSAFERPRAVLFSALPHLGRGFGPGFFCPFSLLARLGRNVLDVFRVWCRSAIRFRIAALRQAFPPQAPRAAPAEREGDVRSAPDTG